MKKEPIIKVDTSINKKYDKVFDDTIKWFREIGAKIEKKEPYKITAIHKGHFRFGGYKMLPKEIIIAFNDKKEKVDVDIEFIPLGEDTPVLYKTYWPDLALDYLTYMGAEIDEATRDYLYPEDVLDVRRERERLERVIIVVFVVGFCVMGFVAEGIQGAIGALALPFFAFLLTMYSEYRRTRVTDIEKKTEKKP
jgi:hypothetical protein